MIPAQDERLASVIRALTDVILPSLPPEASLASEQVQLAIGQLQILRAQLDAAPQFERDELADAVGLAEQLAEQASGGDVTLSSVKELEAAVEGAGYAASPEKVREARVNVHGAIAGLIRAVGTDGSEDARKSVTRLVIESERSRSLKDRQWFAPFGFDQAVATA